MQLQEEAKKETLYQESHPTIPRENGDIGPSSEEDNDSQTKLFSGGISPDSVLSRSNESQEYNEL
jgi:hypothetical protein